LRENKIYINQLLISFTTVFGWMPSLIMLLMLCAAFFYGWSFMYEYPLSILVLVAITICSAVGCIALTSICWPLFAKAKLKPWFLSAGLLAYIAIIVLGFYPGFVLLEFRIHWIEAYFVYLPTCFFAYWLVIAVTKK
jgi:hypothetical protein